MNSTTVRSNLGILLLLLAIIGYVAVVRPQVSTFSDTSLQVKSTTAELDSYNQRLTDLQSIKSQGSSVVALLNNMYLAMPKSTQIPEVLVMIDNIGSNSGVVMTGVGLGTAGSGATTLTASGVSEVPISVSFSGTLTSVTKFLTAVQNNIRTATIDNQTITSDDSGNLSVTMQLGLVYQGGQ